ncbi:anthranilate phosphoribosyltransferase [Acuticoccus sp. M5D2P5]|uniref:anthranilate phosphoribosyltransferase n=1 Tax=Acuticoccus kalidii TaxID=2910977 RepID=UPI001F3B3320|nr:anthranilate phosphoribosyltransferase [Acuticoccus kalidii]MCF3933027.1 anthranilate phosphoribosyltransferase [Acuticoccus kalidii]
MNGLKALIAKAASGETLTRREASEAFDVLMSGEATPAQIGGLLMAMRVRGETVDEITGAVEVMRAKMTPVTAPAGAIDIVGTGGDASGTYNVSTCAAFIVAAAGIPVAKHGNRALSSKSGAADALMALGVRIDLTPIGIAACIEKAGIGFMFAPAHHAAMKHVGPARVELGTRTVFNLLGPLSNPARVTRQLVGVFSAEWVAPIAEVLAQLGTERAWVVHGGDGLDEMTTTTITHVAAVEDGMVRIFTVDPEELGLAIAKPEDLRGADADHNAAALRAVLGGEKNAYRDIACLNAAGALLVAEKVETLEEGVALAQRLLDDGSAAARLQALVSVSQAVAP